MGRSGVNRLNSRNYLLKQTLRTYISDAQRDGMEFCSIPKDGIVFNKDLSTMLRDNLGNDAPDAFPTLLYRRNKDLKGGLTVIKSKLFTTKDKTKRGQSMAGWRLFKLIGDEEFHNSLGQFPENHQFRICSSNIMIRGGDGKGNRSERHRKRRGRRSRRRPGQRRRQKG